MLQFPQHQSVPHDGHGAARRVHGPCRAGRRHGTAPGRSAGWEGALPAEGFEGVLVQEAVVFLHSADIKREQRVWGGRREEDERGRESLQPRGHRLHLARALGEQPPAPTSPSRPSPRLLRDTTPIIRCPRPHAVPSSSGHNVWTSDPGPQSRGKRELSGDVAAAVEKTCGLSPGRFLDSSHIPNTTQGRSWHP